MENHLIKIFHHPNFMTFLNPALVEVKWIVKTCEIVSDGDMLTSRGLRELFNPWDHVKFSRARCKTSSVTSVHGDVNFKRASRTVQSVCTKVVGNLYMDIVCKSYIVVVALYSSSSVLNNRNSD